MEQIDPSELAQLQQIEEMKRKILAQMLSKEAFERLGRVRAANPQLAGQVELYLVEIYQSGKFKRRVTDEEMKEILKAVSEKRDFKIKRI